MPFLEYLEPIANADPNINTDTPPNALFQLSMAISLKRMADAICRYEGAIGLMAEGKLPATLVTPLRAAAMAAGAKQHAPAESGHED